MKSNNRRKKEEAYFIFRIRSADAPAADGASPEWSTCILFLDDIATDKIFYLAKERDRFDGVEPHSFQPS